MAIRFDKTIALMQSKGITTYRIRQDKIMGQALYQKLRTGGDIDTRTINKLCALLDCQPGDLMEYVPDNNNDA